MQVQRPCESFQIPFFGPRLRLQSEKNYTIFSKWSEAVSFYHRQHNYPPREMAKTPCKNQGSRSNDVSRQQNRAIQTDTMLERMHNIWDESYLRKRGEKCVQFQP
jgi:hypothetical protein